MKKNISLTFFRKFYNWIFNIQLKNYKFIYRKDKGICTVAVKDVAIRKGWIGIFGWTYNKSSIISKHVDHYLKREDHIISSLLTDEHNEISPFLGPISLLNHSCDSNINFCEINENDIEKLIIYEDLLVNLEKF